jgi:signal transduction histidine kinase/GAF domain-containing protein
MSTMAETNQKNINLSPARLLEALAILNKIGSTVNQIDPNKITSVSTTLNLIVKGAIKVIPESSAVIYTYNSKTDKFKKSSRVSAGERYPPNPLDEPRPNGMGEIAKNRLKRVISYEENEIEVNPIKVDYGAKAVICFPLVVSEMVVGVLYVYLHDQREFEPLELLMLENFVHQAAMAIYHTNRIVSVQQNLLQKEEEIARLRRTGLLISSRQGLEETLEAILTMAIDVSKSEYGSFRLVDKMGKNLVLSAISGKRLSHYREEKRPIADGSVMGWVAINKKPLVIEDVSVEPWASMYYPLDQDLNIRSEMAVPLISASGQLVGVLNLESPKLAAFNEQDIYLIQGLATQAVIAIQETMLMDALLEITERLIDEPQKNLLNRLTLLICELLNVPASAIWLLDGDSLVLQATNPKNIEGENLSLTDNLIGKVAREKKQISIIDSDIAINKKSVGLDNNGWKRALILPLLSTSNENTESIGVISIFGFDIQDRIFIESDWDKKVLSILGKYASIAIENTSHKEALRVSQEQRSLAETFAALGDVAVNLLHQLNNKISIIPVLIQGMQEKSEIALNSDPYLASNLKIIENGARESMSVLRENFSILQPIASIPIQLDTCVNTVLRDLNLPEGVAIKINNLELLPPVVAGQKSLEIVFKNLIDNALNALNGEGEIKIFGRIYKKWVEVSVRDNGPGIDPSLHEKIFELSYSGSNPAHGGKLGFGLWWVKILMARLGGAIKVKSDGSKGTKIRLRFPLDQEFMEFK